MSSPADGAPLPLLENKALFNEATLAGRCLLVQAPCWRAVQIHRQQENVDVDLSNEREWVGPRHEGERRWGLYYHVLKYYNKWGCEALISRGE